VWHLTQQLLVWQPSSPQLQLQVSLSPFVLPGSVGQWEGKQGGGAALSHAKWSQASTPQIPPVFDRNIWEVAGWANWATTLNHEA